MNTKRRPAVLYPAIRVVVRIDRSQPWHYVECDELNAPLLPADLELEDRPAGE